MSTAYTSREIVWAGLSWVDYSSLSSSTGGVFQDHGGLTEPSGYCFCKTAMHTYDKVLFMKQVEYRSIMSYRS